MNWKTLISNRDPVILATATTGVGETDELLAIALAKPDEEPFVALRNISDDVKLKSSCEYHHVTRDMLDAESYTDEEMCEMLGALTGVPILTYNTKFQSRYLAPWMQPTLISLPMLLQHARRNTVAEIPSDASLAEIADVLASIDKYEPPFRRMCGLLEISADPTPGELPVSASCRALISMFDKLADLKCSLLEVARE